MRMQPYYFWIFNLLILSLLASCSQQQKNSPGVPSVPPKDTGNQPQENTLSLPTLGLTPSLQQNLASQPQQNTLSFPNAVVTSSPQQNIEMQSPKNAQSLPIFEGFVGKLLSQAPLTYFSPDPNKDTQSGQQKPSQFTVPTNKQVPSSQSNPVQQQPSAQNLLNDKILLAQTDKEQTSPTTSLRLSLKEAFERADARNPALLAAQQNLKISAAGITIAGAIPNPQIGLQYGFGLFTPKPATRNS